MLPEHDEALVNLRRLVETEKEQQAAEGRPEDATLVAGMVPLEMEGSASTRDERQTRKERRRIPFGVQIHHRSDEFLVEDR